MFWNTRNGLDWGWSNLYFTMGTFQQKIPEWALRLGFGFMFLYSGFDLLRHPTGWYWAIRPLPQFIQNLIDVSVGIDSYLRIQGIAEIVFALVLLGWFLPRWIVQIVSLLVALEIAAILLLVGISGDTFRDIGLLGAALALFFLKRSQYGTDIARG